MEIYEQIKVKYSRSNDFVGDNDEDDDEDGDGDSDDGDFEDKKIMIKAIKQKWGRIDQNTKDVRYLLLRG